MSRVVRNRSSFPMNPQVIGTVVGSVFLLVTFVALAMLLAHPYVDLPDLIINGNFLVVTIYLTVKIFSRLFLVLRLERGRAAVTVVTAVRLPVQSSFLSLPLVITLRFNWKVIPLLPMCFTPTIVAFPFTGFARNGISDLTVLDYARAIFFVGLIGVIIAIPVALACYLYSKERQYIEVSEEGLTVQWRGITEGAKSSITWQDMHQFVCYHWPSIAPGRKRDMVYQVYSQHEVVSWTRYRDPQSLFSSMKPMLPVDEYHRQMQALVDLIVAKTGLELHDLS